MRNCTPNPKFVNLKIEMCARKTCREKPKKGESEILLTTFARTSDRLTQSGGRIPNAEYASGVTHDR